MLLVCCLGTHSFVHLRASANHSLHGSAHLSAVQHENRSFDILREKLSVRDHIEESLPPIPKRKHQQRPTEKPDHHSHPSRSSTHDVTHDKGGKVKDYGIGYTLCLFGAVAFFTGFLYLVNNDDPGLVLSTWQVLSMTLSIFSALMAYLTIRDMLLQCFLEEGLVVVMVAELLILILAFTLNEAALYLLKDKRYTKIMHSGSALGSQFLGFSASYAFGDMQHCFLFGHGLLGDLLVVVIATIVLTACVYVAKWVHLKVESLHRGVEFSEDVRWERESELMENEAMSMTMGYLVVHSLAHHIRGSHDHLHAYDAPENVTQAQATTILVWAGVFLIALACLIAVVPYRMQKLGYKKLNTLNFESFAETHEVPMDVRMLMNAVNAVGVAMAWCLLLFAEWQVYALGFSGPRSAGVMTTGFFLTVFSFAAIFVLEFLAEHVHTSDHWVDPEKVVRNLSLALGIVVGFAWEKCFSVGLKDIAHVVNVEYPNLLCIVLASLLILIVTPAWAMYVFPMVQFTKETGHNKYRSKLAATGMSTEGVASASARRRSWTLQSHGTQYIFDETPTSSSRQVSSQSPRQAA